MNLNQQKAIAAATARLKLKNSPTAQTPVSYKDKSMLDVFQEAGGNIPKSAAQFGEDIVAPFLSPKETLESIGKLGLGLFEKLTPGIQENEKLVDSVGTFLKDRYGSIEAVKKTIATDPVGIAADLSLILTAPGMLPVKAAKTVANVGRKIDPLNLAASAAGKGAKVTGKLASDLLGITTGAGGEAIRTAAKAGFVGGLGAKNFQEAIKGNVSPERILGRMKGALETIRRNKNEEYSQGMVDIKKDKSVLPMKQIDEAIKEVKEAGTFKGQQIKPSTVAVVKELTDIVSDWKKLPPTVFRTPEALDNLRKRFGDLYDEKGLAYNSAPRRAVDKVYNSVKNTIAKDAPAYADHLSKYAKSMEEIQDIERSMSLGKKAATDTGIRKLQTSLSENVAQNYGQRKKNIQRLEGKGEAPGLQATIAGTVLQDYLPKGLMGKLLGGATAAGSLSTGGLNFLTLPAFSPKLVGAAAFGAGTASRPLARMLKEYQRQRGMFPGSQVTYQAGRGQED